MFKKKLSKIPLILLAIISTVSVLCNPSSNRSLGGSEMIVEVFICPIASLNESYMITVSKNCFMKVLLGNRDNESKILKNVEKEKFLKLSISEFKKIVRYTKRLENIGDLEDKTILKDAWSVRIKTKTNTISVYFNKMTKYPIEIMEFFNYIVSISPLKIDLHSWS